MADLKYWLGFSLVKGIGPAKVRALWDHFGSLANAWQANESMLQRLGLGAATIESLLTTRSQVNLDSELERVQKQGIQLLTWDTPEYPRYLVEVPTAPPVLYLKGDLCEQDQFAVAVVGTRRLTTYGRQVTHELVTGLVRQGITIVSGLAKGIDAVAHKAALDAGGRTLAVLGSGLDNIYPSENRKLAQQIYGGQGAVISEYPLGMPPDARNFPPRNRLISGLSLGVVVIEAGEKSGALITARFAAEQDRDVFAVPGPINSAASWGTNRLIQEGAKLVMRVEDILEELNLFMMAEQVAIQAVVPDTPEEAVLLHHMSRQPVHIDELVRVSGLNGATTSSTLMLMELKGIIQQVGGMNYVLLREPDVEYKVSKP
ncbi:MAG: DNA-protecting protein DprA [Chloroflexi bacterium]|nr:DNA-protecting protein DprA [Chloroflexota bacterium]